MYKLKTQRLEKTSVSTKKVSVQYHTGPYFCCTRPYWWLYTYRTYSNCFQVLGCGRNNFMLWRAGTGHPRKSKRLDTGDRDRGVVITHVSLQGPSVGHGHMSYLLLTEKFLFFSPK